MKLTLDFRNEMFGEWDTAQGYLVENLDHMISQITSGYSKQHNADDTHGIVTADSISTGAASLGDVSIGHIFAPSGMWFINDGARTVTALTGNTNDLTPVNFKSSCYILNITSNGAYNLTGLQQPAIEPYVRVILFSNESAFTITLTHEDGASAPTNRLFLPGGANLAVRAFGGVMLLYMPGLSRWVALTP